jgi:hypothetical protein
MDIEETKSWLRSDTTYLSFNEVWEDIVEMLGRLDEIGEYETHLIINESEEDHIIFESAEKHIVITKSQVVSLWRHLRSVGFCSRQGLPSGLFEYGSLVFKFMSQLPYIEPVSLSHQYSNENDLQIGIRLKPGIQVKMSALAEDTSV